MPIKLYTYVPTGVLAGLGGGLKQLFLTWRESGYMIPEEEIEGVSGFEFQYNPENLSFSKEANWAEKTSPGMAMPTLHYVGTGAGVFPLTLYLENDVDGPPRGFSDQFGLTDCRRFFEALLKPLESKQRPPYVELYFGKIYRIVVAVSLNVTILESFPSLEPRAMTVDLSLKEWGDPGR